MSEQALKPLERVLSDWEDGSMDAAGTIEDLVRLIDQRTRPTRTATEEEIIGRVIAAVLANTRAADDGIVRCNLTKAENAVAVALREAAPPPSEGGV